MSSSPILGALLDFRRLDLLACGDSALHRMDARAKVVITAAFIVCVMSFDRYAVVQLLPFVALPVLAIAASRLPIGYVLGRSAFVLPIAVLIALPNLWFDRTPMLELDGLAISGGQVSMMSIVLRSMLAAMAAVLLVASTGFYELCRALESLGMPRVLAVQLLLLYRYLGVLGQEGLRMAAAREQRANGRRLPMGLYATLVGRLLVRTLDRGERIYLAMCARGFSGELQARPGEPVAMRDIAQALAWIALFVVLRSGDLVRRIGSATLGLLT